MEYKNAGSITSIAEIPVNEKVIISGSTNANSWVWRMSGIFEKRESKIIFKNDYGMSTEVDAKINLTLLKAY